jgi:RluA family pseudouridine synthase
MVECAAIRRRDMIADPDILPPVIFEDDALIAFNKPSGLLVAPDRWDKTRPNLMRMVHEQLSPDFFNVHRIDAETSGVLLCAKTKPALDSVSRMFETREVRKLYLAITRGVPSKTSGSVRKSLAPDEHNPGRMRIVHVGKPCETLIEVVRKWRGFTLVEAVPLTGRTHQIRVHLAFLHSPIVGDTFYGDGRGVCLSEFKPGYKAHADREERPLIGRLGLHAQRLMFKHPVTGADMTIEAPLPKDFAVAIKYLDRFAVR